MKKSFLILSLSTIIIFSGLNLLSAQEQPKPKKDTVNMDTDAKPTFYYTAEDEKKAGKSDSEKGSASTVILIAGVVVAAGAAGFFLLKKKK